MTILLSQYLMLEDKNPARRHTQLLVLKPVHPDSYYYEPVRK